MRLNRKTATGRRRLLPLVGLLLLTLVLTAVLAYQAADAARSHRTAAENTLRDYAAVAAWQYGQSAAKEVYSLIGAEVFHLEDVVIRRGSGRLIDPADHAELHHPDAECGCPAVDGIRYIFLFDPSNGDVAAAGDVPGEEVVAWLADTIRAHADLDEPGRHGVVSIIGDVHGERRLIAFRVRRTGDGGPARVVGFEASPTVLEPRLAASFASNPLLPPSLTRGQPNDSLVAITVHDAGGALLYRSPGDTDWLHFGEEVLGDELSGVVVRATVRPEAASLLLIGGLPRSRLPLLLGLMLLSAGLMAAASLQIRREAELARLRAEFVSGISHELRTPLAQIRMFGETLLLGRIRSEDEGRRSAGIIVQEARRLTHLVENVLHFARSERDTVRIAAEPLRLDRLVREVADAFAPLAEGRGVTIRAAADDLVTALADPDAVRQMLLNLLDNAVKYGPAGQTVTITAARVDGAAVLSVEDEGPGVPLKERERIFEPFARLAGDASSAVGGSGIGLSVVRTIAELHGGRVQVENRSGGGARFTVVLPVAETAETIRDDAVGRAPDAEPPSTGRKSESEVDAVA